MKTDKRLKINSQSLEDTQVGYILQKKTLDKNTLEQEGGDKVPISKFGLWTSAVVFIGLIKTYFVFLFFYSVQKKTYESQI